MDIEGLTSIAASLAPLRVVFRSANYRNSPFWPQHPNGTVATRFSHACNICRQSLSIVHGYAVSRGNILPTFRVCDRCGNLLEPMLRKLESLAVVELDRVIAA